MIKRLIFDVDNTLILNVSFRDPVKKTLTDLGLYSEETLDNYIKGISTYESIYSNYNKNDYIRHMSESINAKLGDDFLDVFFNNLKSAIPKENEKLANCIKELSKRYELVLLTNYFSQSQMNRLNEMGIGKYFSHCYGEEVIKPYPDAYINACGKYNPDECVMIGDDLYLDIKCAQKQGLHTIWVNTRNEDAKDVNSIIVDKVEDISAKLIKTAFNKAI